jgi:hypothetical protein
MKTDSPSINSAYPEGLLVDRVGAASSLSADEDVAKILERIRHRLRKSVKDMIDIGRDLNVIKTRLGHGPFLPFIEKQLGMKSRTAERFMQAAKFADEFTDGRIDMMSNLPANTIYLLSARSTHKTIKTGFVAAIGAGQSVDLVALEKQIKEERIEEDKRRCNERRIKKRQALSAATQKSHEAREQQAALERADRLRREQADEADLEAIIQLLPAAALARLENILRMSIVRDMREVLLRACSVTGPLGTTITPETGVATTEPVNAIQATVARVDDECVPSMRGSTGNDSIAGLVSGIAVDGTFQTARVAADAVEIAGGT